MTYALLSLGSSTARSPLLRLPARSDLDLGFPVAYCAPIYVAAYQMVATQAICLGAQIPSATITDDAIRPIATLARTALTARFHSSSCS